MKRLNKKGFVLVETLIVTAFVMTLFILVYQNVVPYIGEYEKMSSYDDIDSVYATNLLKQSILRDSKIDIIDEYLNNHSYMDITDCSNTDIYKNNEYCEKVKIALSILEDDYIFITEYDIENFRTEVDTNEFFDSGKLSSFKDYLSTVPSFDSFYDPDDTTNDLVGKYRLFVTRTVSNSDGTTTLKYSNLGIYSGKYEKYDMGEEVIFNPGDGDKNFYVLNNSLTSSPTVTLILKNNLPQIVEFNSTKTNSIPDTALEYLKSNTNNWTKAKLLDGYQYSTPNYTIDYRGYYARLLVKEDLLEVLGCTDKENCFNTADLFSINFDKDKIGWLSNGLTGNQGYWLANSVLDNNEMAWAIQDGKISPLFFNGTSLNVGINEIGVRPVIVVNKNNNVITRVK